MENEDWGGLVVEDFHILEQVISIFACFLQGYSLKVDCFPSGVKTLLIVVRDV